MSNIRATETDGRPIVHRPGTVLLPARRCHRGHLAPRYTAGRDAGYCVVCARDSWMACRAERPAQPRRQARQVQPARRSRVLRHVSLAAARADHAEFGGWLLDLGDGFYGVTDSLSVARRLRGSAWLRRCEALQCWDEIEMRPVPLRQRQAEGMRLSA